MNGTQNYWKLGLFVVLTLLTIIGTLVFFGVQGSERLYWRVFTYFDEPVEGLEVGAPVKHRGIRIGEVVSIRSAPDRKHIEVKSHVYDDVLLDLGMRDPADPPPPEVSEDGKKRLALMRVKLVTSFLTGVSFIESDFVDPALVPPKEYPFTLPDPNTNIVFDALPSTLKSIERGLQESLLQLPAVLDSTRALLVTVDKVVVESNVPELSGKVMALVEDLDRRITALDDFEPFVAATSLLREGETTVKEVGSFVRSMQDPDGPLLGLSKRLESLVGTAEAELAAADVPATARALRGASSEATALLETLRLQVRELERTLTSVRKVMDMLERDPGALIRGKSASSPVGGK